VSIHFPRPAAHRSILVNRRRRLQAVLLVTATVLSFVLATHSDASAGQIVFADWSKCPPSPEAWCETAKPSPWTNVEKESFQKRFSELERDSSIKGVISDAITDGYGKVVKFQFGFNRDIVAGKPVYSLRQMASAWVLDAPRGIYVSQRFVDVGFQDEFSKFAVERQKLLHELFHVSDRKHKYSERPSFRSATDIVLSPMVLSDCDRARSAMLRLGG